MRRGHFSPAQKRSLETLLPRHGIAYRESPLDLAACFGRDAPVVLEIGSGMGETTARIAADLPDRNFLAIEVYAPGVGALLRRIEDQGLDNLRVIQHDAVEVLRDMIPEASLAGVHLFFPDPWPKARHHKRRLIQPPFVAELTRRLAPGGYLHCATDWQPYAEQMLEVLSAEPGLVNAVPEGGFSARPAWRPETKFERRGLALGHGVHDLLFYRSRRA